MAIAALVVAICAVIVSLVAPLWAADHAANLTRSQEKEQWRRATELPLCTELAETAERYAQHVHTRGRDLLLASGLLNQIQWAMAVGETRLHMASLYGKLVSVGSPEVQIAAANLMARMDQCHWLVFECPDVTSELAEEEALQIECEAMTFRARFRKALSLAD